MSMGQIGLAKASVLYIGSAVPLETAVGIESVQMPCRDRYTAAIGPDMKVAGIDATLTVYSSGITMQYTGDPSNVTWFPMQSFHVSAAVKAVSMGDMGSIRFVEVDLPEAENSNHPPMFAFIARRTKGVKVLECHVFICKSEEAGIALVQATSYAFEHREGWLSDGAPPPAPVGSSMMFGGGENVRIVPGQNAPDGLESHLVQRYAINSALPQAVVPAAAAAAVPAAAVPAMVQPQLAATQMVPMALQNQYFANWDPYFAQTVMFNPTSPFYPGPCHSCHRKKKKCCCKKKKKKKKKKTKKEIIYVQPPAPQRDYEIFAPSHPQAVNQYVREYNYYAGGEDEAEAEYDETMKDYERTVNQYRADLDDYQRSLDDQYLYDAYDGYAYDPYGYDPYGYNGYNGYNGLVDNLGYYP